MYFDGYFSNRNNDFIFRHHEESFFSTQGKGIDEWLRRLIHLNQIAEHNNFHCKSLHPQHRFELAVCKQFVNVASQFCN